MLSMLDNAVDAENAVDDSYNCGLAMNDIYEVGCVCILSGAQHWSVFLL